MKIVFFGDSITDAGRDKLGIFARLGAGYVSHVGFTLEGNDPKKYSIVNLGIGGNRVVDLYARMHEVWNQNPDVLSILVGVNDVWHYLQEGGRGIDLDRYESTYRLILQDTKKRFPDLKIVILEPFFLPGTAITGHEELFDKVYDYARVAKKIAEEEGAFFLPLQEKLTALAEKLGNFDVLFDGVHPNTAGAKFIADEWLKLYKEKIEG